MASSVKELLAEANAAVERVAPEDVKALIDRGEAVVIDVREPEEVARTGKVPGAVNIPRGMIEFRADADTPSHDERLVKDKTIVLYCGSGGRSALAGKTLRDFGYPKVLNMGAFGDWDQAGLPIESAS